MEENRAHRRENLEPIGLSLGLRQGVIFTRPVQSMLFEFVR